MFLWYQTRCLPLATFLMSFCCALSVLQKYSFAHSVFYSVTNWLLICTRLQGLLAVTSFVNGNPTDSLTDIVWDFIPVRYFSATTAQRISVSILSVPFSHRVLPSTGSGFGRPHSNSNTAAHHWYLRRERAAGTLKSGYVSRDQHDRSVLKYWDPTARHLWTLREETGRDRLRRL